MNGKPSISHKQTLQALVIVLLFVIELLFGGCNSSKTPIRIGVAGTMSGINSDLSVSGRRGVELAITEINKAGGVDGRKLELVIKDDKNNEKTALAIDKEFVNEKVKYVIGHYTSGMIVNSINYLSTQDILFLAPTISADALTGIDDNFIRFIATTKEQAAVLANWARKKGLKQLGVVYDLKNKGFCEVLYENFKTNFQKAGGKIEIVKTFTSDLDDQDFEKLSSAIEDSGVQGVFIISDAVHNAAITQQFRKDGSKVQIFAPLWSNTPDLFRKGGTAVNGMYIVGAIDLDDKREKFDEFKKRFVETYGENPTFASVYSYEATYALYLALQSSDDTVQGVKNSIIKTRYFEGLQGAYEIDKYGDNIRNYMIFEVAKGQLRKVDTR